MDGACAVAARGLVKEYRRGEVVERVLAAVDLDVRRGSFVSVMGPSGSGKSTLLHLLGGLDRPDAGEVLLDGSPLSSLSDEDRTLLRRGRIGIVYQVFNLVPVFSVDENIVLRAGIARRRACVLRGQRDAIVEDCGQAHA